MTTYTKLEQQLQAFAAIYLSFIGLGTHLFVKVPRPDDSEGSFWFSSQAAICNYQSNPQRLSQSR